MALSVFFSGIFAKIFIFISQIWRIPAHNERQECRPFSQFTLLKNRSILIIQEADYGKTGNQQTSAWRSDTGWGSA